MIQEHLGQLGILGVLHILLVGLGIPVILFKKRDPTVAVAWCLVVLLTPFLGALLFWVFGFNYVQRRVKRKQIHRTVYRKNHPPSRREATRGADLEKDQHPLASIARAVEAFPISPGNEVTLYHDTGEAFAAILESLRSARHHIHLEFFIFRNDATSRKVIEVLAEKARAGIEVRLLTDAVGSLFLSSRTLRPLVEAGGKTVDFLPVNPLRSWVQVNLRNHRKVVVVDGTVGYLGGMNIGDEYLGKSSDFGYWRDAMIRLEGSAVASLQRVFVEDWHFATSEALDGLAYYPELPGSGEHSVQIVESGPDQGINSIREIYFAAVLTARKRIWIATPYFVPDSGMLDALRLARMRGVEILLLCLYRPDHRLSFYASRYYWQDLLEYGGHVFQYQKGMMHSKVLIVDDDWAMVGSANLDNRSLHLNFEVGCLLYSPELVAELAHQFKKDLEHSIPLDRWTFANRPFLVRLMENACRLFSPVL